MKAISKLALTAAVITNVFFLSAAFAQGPEMRTVEQYTCKDIMRESGADRDVAIAFLHGFFLGKAATTTFNLDVIHTQTTDFIERCLSNPLDKAVDVMSKLKRE
jgi:HdeA/HdeB family